MKNLLISVLVAAYNVEKYLPRFFHSIINQTYNNLEIIIVEDGSTDSTGEMCNSFAEKHPNVKVIHTSNGGLSVARNVSLKYATGDYISFIDPDDDISLDFYSKVVDFIDHTNCDLIILNHYCVYSNKSQKEMDIFVNFDKTGIVDKQVVMRMLLSDTLGSQVWEKIYKRDLWKDVWFIPGRVFAEDVAIVHEVYDRAEKIGAIAEPLYYYYFNDATLSRSYRPFKWMSTYLAFKERLEFAEKKYPEMVEKLNAYTLNLARLALDNYLQKHESCDEPYIPEIINRLKVSKKYLKKLDLKWYNKLIILYYIYFPRLYSYTIKYIHSVFYFFKPNKFR